MTLKTKPGFLRPPSLFAQVFGMVLISLAAAVAVNLIIVFALPPPPPEFYRLSEVVQALRAEGKPVTARNGRIMTATLVNAPHPPFEGHTGRLEHWLRRGLAGQLGVAPETVEVVLLAEQHGPRSFYLHALRSQMGPDFNKGEHPPASAHPPPPGAGFDHYHHPPFMGPMEEMRAPSGDNLIVSPFEVDVRRPDGRWTALKMAEGGLLATWQRRVVVGFILSSFCLAPVAFLFARRLARPISAFAKAAERLGRDPGAPPLELRGPAELRTAIEAFNQMQERIRRYVQDRTSMVGAVAHDLRTPLTRLRFRIESVPEALRDKLAADLDEMEAMIAATLAFVRDASHTGPRQRLDLSALVQTAADDLAETGAAVALDPAYQDTQVIIEGDGIGLRRMVANLIDNGLKFGGSAKARVYQQDGEAVIEIDDDGPGLPQHELEAVFEPFHRGEPSRSRETGGAGLGLAVVRSVARAHGGDAHLINLRGGGLRARVRLPLLDMIA